jgi:hypothetical protein
MNNCDSIETGRDESKMAHASVVLGTYLEGNDGHKETGGWSESSREQ